MYFDILSDVLRGYLALVIIWLVTFIIVLITLMNRKDIALPVKIFWGGVIFVAPLIGLIFYLIFGLGKRQKLLSKTEKRSSST